MNRTYVIDSTPGDGIGVDVTDVAMKCVDVTAELHGFSVQWRVRGPDGEWMCAASPASSTRPLR